MRKLMNGKIRNTEKMQEITYRISHYSHSNNPIGWKKILMDDSKYYLQTVGGCDIYAPENDLEYIGDIEALADLAASDHWNRDNDLLDHLEKYL